MFPKTFLPYFILLSAFLNAGCAATLNITGYFDTTEPLIFTDSTYKKEMIPVQSEKYMKLMQWADKNTTDWQSSIASYQSKFSVTQEKTGFKLLVLQNGVVIGFTDSKNQPRQYAKNIKIGELDFLLH